MHYRPLGHSNILVSEIGFGCWTMGGPNWSPQSGQAIGWAAPSDDDVLAGVKAGLDAGVNHWDNADVYGNGKAERLLAWCFQKLGVDRSKQVIATKVGHFRGTAPYAYHPAHIRSQCEQSLRNLRSDHIDLYYFHHATFKGPDLDGREHDYLHEAAATMHALVKEGKVRAIGQSGYNAAEFERCLPIVKPCVIQNKANLRYDEFVRPGSTMQRLMREHKCAYVAFGPLDQGILLDKFDPDNPPQWSEGEYRASRKDFAPATLRAVRAKLAHVKDKARAGGFGLPARAGTSPEADLRDLASIAQRWLLAHENVCSVIPGFRNARQAAINVSAANDEAMHPADVEWLRQLFQAS